MSTLYAAGIVVVFFVAVALQKVLLDFVISKGVAITGDEPTYIMQAQALSHFNVHILSTITHDLSARVFGGTYPPNATLAIVEHYDGPTGVISPVDPGLSALLAVPVALLGPVTGALGGIIALYTAGLMWLHQRVSRLLRLGAMAQVVLGVAFAIPAVLVAVNQIYPDLPAGILLAIGLVEIAAIKWRGKASALSLLLITASVAASPWLQPKNLVPAAVILAAFLLVMVRRKFDLVPAAVVAGASVLSVVLFLLYNQHFYGHILGLPEPMPKVSAAGLQYTLGLLFDRHQGLFIQVPYALVGLAGLIAFGRRRMPVAAVATLLSFLAILGLNGTYTGNPYGGYSLAGRFMWTLIPMSLPWVGLVLARLKERDKSLAPPLIVVVLIWLYQAEPIFAGQHFYYNAFQVAHIVWPGWWWGLVGFLPQFGSNANYFGNPVWSLPLELIFDATVIGVLLYWLREPVRGSGSQSSERRGRHSRAAN